MKYALALVAIFCSSLAKAGDCKGHIFYLNLIGNDSEITADFDFYYKEMKSYLNKLDVSSSMHKSIPPRAPTCFINEYVISDFSAEVGYLIVTSDGRKKTYSGVMTDVDLMLVVSDFIK